MIPARLEGLARTSISGRILVASGLLLVGFVSPARGLHSNLFMSNARHSDASIVWLNAQGAPTVVLTALDGLGSPRGLATSPTTGALFIADPLLQRVLRWDQASGLSVFADALDGVGNPEGLAFTPDGSLFVSNARNSDPSILLFTPEGNGVVILSIADGLGSPRGLAIEPATGDLFIADALAQVVLRWNASDGLQIFADSSDGLGNPVGLAFAADGALYVSNARNLDASILRFDQAGNGMTILGLADGLGSPRGLAIDPHSGDLFIADALGQVVLRWSAANGLIVFSDSQSDIGNPEGLAFSSANSIAGIPTLFTPALFALASALALVGLHVLRGPA